MKTNLIIALALILGLAHGQASIQLLGRLRDFSNSNSGQPEAHPDFNSYSGHETDLVKVDLGADGKPVFNKDRVPTATTLTSEARFNQWYNDVKDVNIPSDFSITLNNDGNGVYTYDNQNFFPLDGQGYGNDQYTHNYGFTYEIHTIFTYQKGQNFYFRGDDDLWVFINKKRVIDLGGVHGAMDQNVNLDDLGLTEGEDYTLDIFFAERHYSASSFKIQTSIQLKPTCLPPKIYNGKTNKCDDCILPSVYLASTGGCGSCNAPMIYNDKTFTCEDCKAPLVYDAKKGGCAPCSEGVYLAASKSCGTCKGPKVYDPVAYTCDNCPIPEFYNFDGTCIPDCPKNLQDKVGGVPICGYPCKKTQIYQVATKKCRCDCPKPSTPTTVNGYNICINEMPMPSR